MKPAMLFACLRGLVFIVPSFIIMPRLLGDAGIWLAMAVSEALTTAAIALYYFLCHSLKKVDTFGHKEKYQ